MYKETRLYSILNFKCPRCHKGQFLVSNNPYNFKKAGEVLDHCECCGLKYAREPGFYYGAMYAAYALGVAVMVAVWVALMVLYPDYSTELLLSLIFITLFVTGPYIYALSKIIWANFFFHYEEEHANCDKKKQNETTIN